MSSNRGRKAPVAKPKFVGRRSQAARAELEKEEADKKAAEEAEALESARKSTRLSQGLSGDRGSRGRGTGNRGRGRGNHARDVLRAPIASGPFSAGHASHDVKSGHARWSGGGASGPFGGGGGPSSSSRSYGGIKAEEGGYVSTGDMSRIRSVKAEDGGYISSDDDEMEGVILKKQNIDALQNRVVDLTVADEESAEDPWAPVRLTRVQITARKVGLSAEELAKRTAAQDESTDRPKAASEKKKGKSRAQDIEITGSTNKSGRATAYSSSSDAENTPKIKPEPVDDESELQTAETTASTSLRDIDKLNADANVVKDPPSSPETKRRAKENIKASAMGSKDDVPFKRPKTPPYPTQPEVDEFRNKWANREIVFAELGRNAPKSQPTAETANVSGGDSKMGDKLPEEKSVRDDQVYMFQLTPILPHLYPINTKVDPNAPESEKKDGEQMEVDQEDSKQPANTNTEDKTSRPQPHHAHGKVGKLRVHKSGRVFLDWGGVKLRLKRGIPRQHLNTAVVAKVPETKPGANPDEDSKDVGHAVCLGEIKEHFVLGGYIVDDSD